MVKVTFLGTGSAVPTARKNHPAVLLSYKSENILFDCGEGTQRQFRKARLSPAKLTRIFITHWHGDHVLGIPGLLYTLNLNEFSGTLKIYGPAGTKKFMKEILKTYANTNRIDLEVYDISSGKVVEEDDFEIYAEKMEHDTKCLAYSFVEKDRLRIRKEKLEKLKLGHSPELKKLKQGKDIKVDGKKLKAKDLTYVVQGKKVAIVLDTRMNSRIKKIAKGANLLVIESTFFDEKDIAKEYGHMVLSDVVKVAIDAKVEKLFLTHLSQRYEKDSKMFLDEARKKFKETYLAKDLDVVEV